MKFKLRQLVIYDDYFQLDSVEINYSDITKVSFERSDPLINKVLKYSLIVIFYALIIYFFTVHIIYGILFLLIGWSLSICFIEVLVKYYILIKDKSLNSYEIDISKARNEYVRIFILIIKKSNILSIKYFKYWFKNYFDLSVRDIYVDELILLNEVYNKFDMIIEKKEEAINASLNDDLDMFFKNDNSGKNYEIEFALHSSEYINIANEKINLIKNENRKLSNKYDSFWIYNVNIQKKVSDLYIKNINGQ